MYKRQVPGHDKATLESIAECGVRGDNEDGLIREFSVPYEGCLLYTSLQPFLRYYDGSSDSGTADIERPVSSAGSGIYGHYLCLRPAGRRVFEPDRCV